MSTPPWTTNDTRQSATPTSPGGYDTASAAYIVIPQPSPPVAATPKPPQDSTPSSPPHPSSPVAAIPKPPLDSTPSSPPHPSSPITTIPKPPTSISQAPSSPAASLQSQHEKRKRVSQKEKQPTILAR